MADKKPNDDKDIWNRHAEKQDGPPDLDELINKLQHKINGLFGKKKPKAGAPVIEEKSGRGWFGIIIGLFLIIWFLSGIYIVSPAQRAAVLRFGKYVRTVGPGPHWIPRFFESKQKVNVQNISTYPYTAEMLTKDENIVSVAVAVQYRINNVRNYLFNVVNPTESLQQATASALRQVIGQTTLDEALTTGRETVREQVSKQLNDILVRYHTGLVITDVTIQPTKPPEAVTEAFDDVNKAREDEQRYINSANAYKQKVVPIAQGKAKRIITEAKAYEQQVILDATANTTRFMALLPQYERAPQVMRSRLYLDTMQQVLTNSSPVIVDTKSGNVMYLPLDKLLKNMAPIKIDASDKDTAVAKSLNKDTDDSSVYGSVPSYNQAGGY